MRLVWLAMLAACSSPHNLPAPTSPGSPNPPGSPGSPNPPASPNPPPKAARAVTAEVFCERFDRLTSACERFAKARMNPATCIADVRDALAAPQAEKSIGVLARCVVELDGCDEVIQCIANGQPDATAPEALRACSDASQNSAEHAVGIPKASWDRRNGAAVSRFRDARSTKATPIEMCGVSAANYWLTTLQCNDGSRPIKDVNDAEEARPGNVGIGGRCRSIIDRYVVPCPEASYEIFIDPYICPQAF